MTASVQSVAADLGVLRTQLDVFGAAILENTSGTQTKLDVLEAKLTLRDLYHVADAAVRALNGGGKKGPDKKTYRLNLTRLNARQIHTKGGLDKWKKDIEDYIEIISSGMSP